MSDPNDPDPSIRVLTNERIMMKDRELEARNKKEIENIDFARMVSPSEVCSISYKTLIEYSLHGNKIMELKELKRQNVA